jgi:hypothetical protein
MSVGIAMIDFPTSILSVQLPIYISEHSIPRTSCSVIDRHGRFLSAVNEVKGIVSNINISILI